MCLFSLFKIKYIKYLIADMILRFSIFKRYVYVCVLTFCINNFNRKLKYTFIVNCKVTQNIFSLILTDYLDLNARVSDIVINV